MLYAWVAGVKRPPLAKGEKTVCRDCGSQLTAVIPVENVRHWRHKGKDCDPWSEPEGPWHLGWKEAFDVSCREIGLVDQVTGERHRADILCGGATARATVVELQHSTISEDERNSREQFYQQAHRMFWLVHIHNEASFAGYNFRFSLDFQSRLFNLNGKKFAAMRWAGRSQQFIEKWKRATAHVFFEYEGHIFYLASPKVTSQLGVQLKRGEFALSYLTRDEFIRSVLWLE